MKTLTLTLVLNFLFIGIYAQEVKTGNTPPIERFKCKKYENFRDYLQKNLRFPEEAFQHPGVLIVSLTLNVQGKIVEVSCINSLSNSIDKQLIKTIFKSSEFWTPISDSISRKENETIYISIVYCLKNTEYKIESENFNFELNEPIILTALVGTEQLSPVGYVMTMELRKRLVNFSQKRQYDEAKDIMLELLRRDPLNTKYYFELIHFQKKLGDQEQLCKYVKFVEKYLVQPIEKEELDGIECK